MISKTSHTIPTSLCMQTMLNVGDRLRALTIVIVFQEYLNSQYHRSLIWKLNFKESKCVHIRSYHIEPCVVYNLTINNNSIPTRENHRDLGVIVSSDLSWQSHHNHIAARTYRILSLLRQTFGAADSVK